MTASDAYPEHEKLKKISDRSQAIGEFIEWLAGEKGYHLAEVVTKDMDCDFTPHQLGGSVPVTANIRGLLAEFFEIDERKIEDEKRAMLAACAASGPSG